MMNSIKYLKTKWQIVAKDELFSTYLAIAPLTGNVDDVKMLVGKEPCVIYVILSAECNIKGIPTVYTVMPKQQPVIGLNTLLSRQLFDHIYYYGLVHKIPTCQD